MGVYTFVCRKSGNAWSAKQINDGDLESSGPTTYELQRNVVKTVQSSDNSGGVSSSFSLVSPDSAVFQHVDDVLGQVGHLFLRLLPFLLDIGVTKPVKVV
ncbi:hypothetical protein ACFE04_011201 [Oxalis oulophora]